MSLVIRALLNFLLRRLRAWHARRCAESRSLLRACVEGRLLGAPALVAVAIAVGQLAVTYAVNYAVSRLFGPRPKPIEKGRLTGDLQIQDSQYGNTINEIYGGDPITSAAFWTAATAITSNTTIKPTASNGHYYI